MSLIRATSITKKQYCMAISEHENKSAVNIINQLSSFKIGMKLFVSSQIIFKLTDCFSSLLARIS
jgi:hypothetical protein